MNYKNLNTLLLLSIIIFIGSVTSDKVSAEVKPVEETKLVSSTELQEGKSDRSAVSLKVVRNKEKLFSSDTIYKSEEDILKVIEEKNELKIYREDTNDQLSILKVKGIKSNQVGILKTSFDVEVDDEIISVESPTTIYGTELLDEKGVNVNTQEGETLYLQYPSYTKNHISYVNDYPNSLLTGDRIFGKQYAPRAKITYSWALNESGTEFDYGNAKNYDNPMSGSDYNAYIGELQNGFNTVYVKQTERDSWYPNPITGEHVTPVNVFVETPNFKRISDDFAVKILNSKGKFPFLSGKDMRRQTKAQIEEQLKADLTIEVWDMMTQQKIEEPVDFVSSTITNGDNRGSQDITVNFRDVEYTMKQSLLIVSDEVINDFGDLSDWEEVILNDSKGVVENPFNQSTIGMTNRGYRGYGNSTIGYNIFDENLKSIPFVNLNDSQPNGKQLVSTNFGIKNQQLPLYSYLKSYNTDQGFSKAPNYDIQRTSLPNQQFSTTRYSEEIETKYFLKNKKGDRLLQILVDNTNEVTYTYSLKLARNFSFHQDVKMYNNRKTTREFLMTEMANIFYYEKSVPVYSMGNHKGFYLRPNDASQPTPGKMMKYSVKLKNNQLNWLSDYQRYYVTEYFNATNNPFGLEGEITRQEGADIKEDQDLMAQSYAYKKQPGYALSTYWTPTKFDGSLHGGYEVFLGNEIPYIETEIDPTDINIYQNEWSDEFNIKTKVSSMPSTMLTGELELSTDLSVSQTDFQVGPGQEEVVVDTKLSRKLFPKELNQQSGTIKQYPVAVNVTNTTKDDKLYGLPSEEEYFNLNVYNLGAKSIVHTAKQHSQFTKKAEDLVKDPVIKPGGKAKYVYYYNGKDITHYEDPAEIGLDLEKIGTQIIQVKMSDSNDKNNRFTLIDVPVVVYESKPPEGLYLEAYDFKLDPDEIDNSWTDTQIEELIISKTRARAFDMDDKTEDGVTIEMLTKDLPIPPLEGEDYLVELKASKQGKKTVKRAITMTVNKRIEAQAKEQVLILGQQDINYLSFVQNVKASGVDLDPKEGKYEVNLAEGEKIPEVVSNSGRAELIKVKVNLVEDKKNFVEVDVPITTLWGNTISFGGDEIDGRMGGGSYALDKNQITALSGSNTTNDNNLVSSLDKNYSYSLSWYDLSKMATSQIFTYNDTTIPTRKNSAAAKEKKQDVLDKWGENRVQRVTPGDLLRGESSDYKKQYLTNNELTSPSALKIPQNDVFYEVTDSGYRRLQFNRAELGNNQVIKYDTNREELDERAKKGEFLKLKKLDDNEVSQAKIVGFKNNAYPDTSKPNVKTEGTLLIEEVLETNRRIIQYEVPVEFIIVDGGLSFQSADDLSFGQHKLPRKDSYLTPENKKNEVSVLDTRYEPKKWNLQATLEEPLQYSDGKTKYPLVGSSIVINDFKGSTQTLSKETTTIYEVTEEHAKRGINTISWDNKANEGYRLFVKQGSADKNKKYQSTILYSIEDKPKAYAIGNK